MRKFLTLGGHGLNPIEEFKRTEGIPLLIHIPDQKGQVVAKTGSQLDLAPTLLHLLGIQKVPLYMPGDNLAQ